MHVPEFIFPTTIDDVIHQLQQSRDCLLKELQEQFPAPAPGRWSKEEILYHLVLAEQSITRAVQKLLAAPPSKSPRTIAAIREEWELMHNGLLDRTATMNAPERVQPLQAPPLPEIQAMMKETREGLIHLLHSTSYEALDTITFPHGKLGDLSGLVWSSLIAHHEVRHIEQLRELRTTTV